MPGIDPLSVEQIETALSSLPGWSFEDDKLKVSLAFSDFNHAFGFLTQVALLAEQAGHHPEIFNVYNQVKLALNTHDAGGKVTQKDVQLARLIAKIAP